MQQTATHIRANYSSRAKGKSTGPINTWTPGMRAENGAFFGVVTNRRNPSTGETGKFAGENVEIGINARG